MVLMPNIGKRPDRFVMSMPVMALGRKWSHFGSDRCTFPRIALLPYRPIYGMMPSPPGIWIQVTGRQRPCQNLDAFGGGSHTFASAARTSTRNHLLMLSSSSPLRSKHPVDLQLHMWLGNQQKGRTVSLL